MSFMMRRSTPARVTFDPSLLCRYSCRRCFSFRTTFSSVFLSTFACIPPTGLAGGYHVFWDPFHFLSDFVDFPLFPLGFPLLLLLICDVFSLGDSPFPLPLWSHCQLLFPEPTLESKSSAAFTTSLKPSLLSVSTVLESLCSSLLTFLTTETKRFPSFSSSSFFGHLLFLLQVIVSFLLLGSSFVTHLVYHVPIDFQCMVFRCFRVNSLADHVLQAQVWPFLL